MDTVTGFEPQRDGRAGTRPEQEPTGEREHGMPQGDDDDRQKQDPPQGDPPKQDPPDDDPPKDDPSKGDDDSGFAPITSQEEFDKRIKERLARERGKFADYADLKKRAAKADELAKAQESEAEKRIREAREEAERETREKIIPGLVMAEFRAAAAGKIDRDRLADLTDDIDLRKYLLDDGTVDVEKVTKKVEAWAPKGDQDEKRRPKPDNGQGPRNTGKVSGIDKGREMFEKRHGKKPAAK